MSDHKNWRVQEDQMIKQLVNIYSNQQNSRLKWTAIAKQINNKLNNSKKTGKQCRQRWHNKLNPNIKQNIDWDNTQQEKLYQLHNQYGNKWAKIANQLPGRTDNCVKNHFYSSLRKGMRRLNKYISTYRKKDSIKQLKPIVLSKLLAVADQNYKDKLQVKQQALNISKLIKNKLIRLSMNQEVDQNNLTANDIRSMNQIIQQLRIFLNNCKKRKGKFKKQIINQKNIKKSNNNSINNQKSNSIDQQELQQSMEQQQQENQQSIKIQQSEFKKYSNFTPLNFDKIIVPTFIKQSNNSFQDKNTISTAITSANIEKNYFDLNLSNNNLLSSPFLNNHQFQNQNLFQSQSIFKKYAQKNIISNNNNQQQKDIQKPKNFLSSIIQIRNQSNYNNSNNNNGINLNNKQQYASNKKDKNQNSNKQFQVVQDVLLQHGFQNIGHMDFTTQGFLNQSIPFVSTSLQLSNNLDKLLYSDGNIASRDLSVWQIYDGNQKEQKQSVK